MPRKSLLLIICLLFLFFLYSFIATFFKPLRLQQNLEYSVVPGETFSVFMDDLAMRGIIQYPQQAIVLSKLLGYSTELQTGRYLLKPAMSLKALLLLLTQHRVHYYPVTMLDGWTFAMLMQHLAANPYLLHDISMQQHPADLMIRLSGQDESPEGQFLAQTYFVTLDSSEYDVLERAYQAMQQKLSLAWNHRQADLPLRNKKEALILASLLEEESQQAQDMPLIASVFYNRLQVGMPLQSDPTVLYAVGKPYGSHISHRDLRSHSRFNTYRYEGLPPTPIGLPGQNALWAALHPRQSGYYYFEADGHGGVIFSKNLREQEKAIARYHED